MKRSLFKSSRLMVLLAVMAVLLPLLAVLQYHWLGQVSEGASERLRQSLQAGAMRFRQDFNREFIRAYLNFQMDSAAPLADPAGPASIEQDHLERIARWNKTAPYPQLVNAVFLVDYDGAGRLRLRRVNPESRQLESTSDSPVLERLRTRFGIRSEAVNSRTAVPATGVVESFAEDLPALIVPLPSANEAAGEAIRPPGFTVIMLNEKYLQHEFIPSLIQRHFAGTSNEYDLAIVSLRDPKRVIYSSRNPVPDLTSFDVSTRIFGIEPAELQAFVRSEGTPMSNPAQTGARLMRLNLKYLRGPEASSAASQREDGRWQLLIKHQSGSLAAAVSSVRRRNLAIGFGILLLLAGAIVMTAISTRRAERLAEQRINFVAAVTHELRTPLAVICAAGENLADGIVDDPAKAINYGRMIHKEGRRLAEMVEQVLEFAGAQSGRRRYESQLIVVEDLIADAMASCQREIEKRNFTIETSVASALPLIKGDAPALKRALQNLINNAMKYNGKNCWAKVSAHAQGDELLIVVEDRGLGIGAADLPHVFEPFYRGHEAIAAQIEGSGVGLSLVKQIIEGHGGRVTVKSTPNIGSTFTVHLPSKAVADESCSIAQTSNHESTHSAH